jgi:sarcosine oxidase subunit beta
MMAGMERADVVVVGAGTIGGWASCFARAGGAGRVLVIERDRVGQGASSRAAGIVRAQGGAPETVALGRWSIDFYRRQRDAFGVDSGFRQLGYLLLAVTAADVRDAHERIGMQRAAGLDDVRWLGPEEACREVPALAPTGHRGGSFREADGCIDPARNVLAYSLAMQRMGVELREGVAFTGLRTRRGPGGARVVTGVDTSDGPVSSPRVVLTGGPALRAVGRLAGVRIPVGAARHQVAVTEPHPAFAVERMPMVFDLGAGLYWRLEEHGLLFGMSNPDETPGVAREVDWPYLRRMQRRLHRWVPATKDLGLRKAWAATIDYTPDHLPIIGPALAPGGDEIRGLSVASAGGHGMMWGPAVAQAAIGLALEGRTDVVDVSGLGLGRFDSRGRSSAAADRIALPFPVDLDADDSDDAGHPGPTGGRVDGTR